jgi:D-alanine-D-alanine ligase
LGEKIRVAVLMGGLSAERAVSLSTGKQILEALNSDKYTAIPVDAGNWGGGREALPTGEKEVAAIAEAEEKLRKVGSLVPASSIVGRENGFSGKPDVAFIALHGLYGEDGTVQGMLELLGIPYTGSGVLASALAIDKIMSKRVFRMEGIPVPPSVDIISRKELKGRDIPAEVAAIGYPVMVKPNRQGSTIGMSKVEKPEDLMPAVHKAFEFDSSVLIEAFVKGTEITVAVLGNSDPQVLPLIEIVPSTGFYDYEAKYTPGVTNEIIPARIPEDMAERARKYAAEVHKVLGCRGMSRTDMIIAGSDIYILEVNTIPGMTPTSLLPQAAAAAGIPFPELLDRLIELALEEE